MCMMAEQIVTQTYHFGIFNENYTNNEAIGTFGHLENREQNW